MLGLGGSAVGNGGIASTTGGAGWVAGCGEDAEAEDEEERRRSRTIVRRKKGTDRTVALMCDRLHLRVVLVTSFRMLQERP
jgi:hypothetical protein